MVMSLTPPTINNDCYIDSVVFERRSGRNATFFQDIKPMWKSRIDEYQQACGDPSVIQPWALAKADGEKFINLYSHPSGIQKPVLEELRSRVLQLCPACGEDGTPNTLDHYLPKHAYPEFSIAPHNLFPMCDICQGKKGQKTVNSANERFFLHPYFDQFASQQVVKLSIAPPFNSPITFAINPHSCLTQQEAALVERHLKELDVAIRYQSFFKTEYIRLLKLVGRARANQQNVKDRIDGFRQYAFEKAVNSWGHIFYDGVFSDLDLMSHLDSAALPHHL